MGNRLDTELKQITQSLSLLKESHENQVGSVHGSPSFGKPSGKGTPKAKGLREPNLLVKDSLELPSSNENNQVTNMTLNDPKGFEDRLMKRVKEALKGIID
jgi:hypothetical protein